MFFLLRAALVAAFLFSCGGAFAQGAVQQSQPVIAGHGACWAANGIIRDCGVAIPGPGGPFLPLSGGNVTGPVTGLSFPVLQATNYGVKADGTTSDDVALKAAIDACSALVGGQLFLPQGHIKLTGTATSTLSNCHLRGTGAPGGTTFDITSTSVKPFVCRYNWSLNGLSFYYPNQTSGTTSYPPTISDDGSNGCGHFFMDQVIVVNAYDFLKASVDVSWVDFQFSNMNVFAVHHAFTYSLTGDSITYSNVRFTMQPWVDIVGSSAWTSIGAAIGAGNAMFYIDDQTGNLGVTMVATNSETFAWHYAFLFAPTGFMQNSEIDMAFDGVGSIIDSSTGGLFAANNIVRGTAASCGVLSAGGGGLGGPVTPSSCFNIGNRTWLNLQGFIAGGASKDFITANASTVYINGGLVGASGTTGDTYMIHHSGGVGGSKVVVRNMDFGYGSSVLSTQHGIRVEQSIDTLVLQNATLRGLNDTLVAPYANNTMITGNNSIATVGQDITLTGGGFVVYNNNSFAHRPVATVSACGSSTTVSGGTFTGTIFPAGGSVTTCTLHVPIHRAGEICHFGLGLPILNATVPTGDWQFNTVSDMAGTQLTFACVAD